MAELWRVSVHPRWSDQDLNGHVNHVSVLSLLEEARVKWRAAGPVPEGRGERPPTVVASLQVDYRAPVNYGAVEIEMRVIRVGRSSFTLGYRAHQEGTVVLEGSTVLVAIDHDTGASRPLEERERVWLASYAGAEVSVG